jgi:HlyD family secretion protein
MVLNAQVNQVDAERLRLGMKATIHVDAYPDVALPGTLVGIGAMSKSSTFRANYVGEIPVRIRIDQLDSHLIPELTGSAEIVIGAENRATIVPRSAVVQGDGAPYVMVREQEGWAKRPVDLGLASFTNVAIHSGLHSGDTVALEPAGVATAAK